MGSGMNKTGAERLSKKSNNRSFDKNNLSQFFNFILKDSSFILIRVYNAMKNPKYVSGEWTKEQVFLEFLSTYDTPNESDGLVSFLILPENLLNEKIPYSFCYLIFI